MQSLICFFLELSILPAHLLVPFHGGCDGSEVLQSTQVLFPELMSDSSQQPVTAAPEDQMPSSGLFMTSAKRACAHIHTHTHTHTHHTTPHTYHTHRHIRHIHNNTHTHHTTLHTYTTHTNTHIHAHTIPHTTPHARAHTHIPHTHHIHTTHTDT